MVCYSLIAVPYLLGWCGLHLGGEYPVTVARFRLNFQVMTIDNYLLY